MNLFRRMMCFVVAGLMAACGGGGSDPYLDGDTDGTTTDAAGTITVSLSDTTVSAANPATVSAKLVDSNGKAVSGAVISFSTSGSLGSFSSSTALTNGSGVASVKIYPAESSTSGADEVVAEATYNGDSLSATAGFQINSTDVTIADFSSDVGSSSLSAYGQTTLSVSVEGASSGSSVGISLSSICVTNGKASLTPSSATTTTGTATFTYRDAGCGATRSTDTVTATIQGSTTSETLDVGLTSPDVSSVSFSSASPSTIYLKGSGFAESSQVTFKVVDLANNPLPNQAVTLALTTFAGGLTIDGTSSAVTKNSDSSGNVSAIVNSGTVPTPVRVKATLGNVTTVSSTLAVAVGLPSQLNMSLSQETVNIEGYDIDGTTNTYTIIASDRMGNPVPDGTAVSFVAEGGQIEAVGSTSGNPSKGGTTVNYQSSEPRPSDGRVTILAYALGEESFLDTNGNNIHDSGEAFQDLGDLYLDRAFDGVFNRNYDQYVALSVSESSTCATVSASNDPLGLLTKNRSIPSIDGTCDGSWGRAYVRRAAETVLSTSSSRPLWGTSAPNGLDDSCDTVTLVGDNLESTKFYKVGDGVLYAGSAAGFVSIVLADANPERLNPMAAGTVLSLDATDGLTVKVTGGSPVPNTSSASTAVVGFKFSDTVSAGTITLNIKSPSGLTTSVPFAVRKAALAGTACSK